MVRTALVVSHTPHMLTPYTRLPPSLLLSSSHPFPSNACKREIKQLESATKTRHTEEQEALAAAEAAGGGAGGENKEEVDTRRQDEIDAIETALTGDSLKLREILSDGHCLYVRGREGEEGEEKEKRSDGR